VRILFLSQRVPYPPNRGDKITTWRLIERMRRAHEVRVIAFAHDDADREAARHLNSIGFPTVAVDHDAARAKLRALPHLLGSRALTLAVYGSKALQDAVDRETGWADLAYAYSSSMGAFLEPHAQLKRVMHFAELDSDKWRLYAERSAPPMNWIYAREQRTLLEFESRIARSFTENVFCTPLEQKIFETQIPGAHSIVLRNGVDTTFYQPRPEQAEARHLVFTGVMDYLPNIDGCEFFAREVLPILRARFSDLRFTIVGSKPTAAVRALERLPGVSVTGFVDDTRAWLAKASISVAPLRIARGIQNKVLEALAMGLPVVGTSSATQGIEGVDGRDFLVADSAQDFAAATARLLDAPAEARALGLRGREFAQRRYDWEQVFEPLDRLLQQLSPT
jgi:sugar transferase (PEP-CTERM/EpsH1 system associated)